LEEKDGLIICDLNQGNPVLSSALGKIGLPLQVESIGAFIQSLKEIIGLSMVAYIGDRCRWMEFFPRVYNGGFRWRGRLEGGG